MFDKWFMRVILLPLSLLFGIGVYIKSLLYQTGLLKGVRFNIPVINVGNLTVGGSGKTPHVEYLIRLLSPYLPVATLSRGYKRKTRGFALAQANFTADQVGDEPLMYKRKYPHVTVAVSESRALGVPKLLQMKPEIRVVVLDDAYQHRAVEPNLNILLTDFSAPFYTDWLLPSGRLREWRAGYKRADIIIVTKCPPSLTPQDAEEIALRIRPQQHQKVFFSQYRYFPPYQMWNSANRKVLAQDVDVLLVCGIARTEYILDYLHDKAGSVKLLQFEDHHVYSRYDLETIKKYFDTMEPGNRVIVTTEKDAMRLEGFRKFLQANQMEVYILPIQVEFLFSKKGAFDDLVKEFLLSFKF